MPSGVDAAGEVDERKDPGLVAVRVGAAPGDDEPVEAGRLGVGGELLADGVVDAPALAILLQQRTEHGEEVVTDACRMLPSPRPHAQQRWPAAGPPRRVARPTRLGSLVGWGH